MKENQFEGKDSKSVLPEAESSLERLPRHRALVVLGSGFRGDIPKKVNMN